MGFDETSEALKNFSFKDLFEDIIAVPFDFITSVVNWIPTVFTDPVQAMQDLWNGVVGEGGLLDIIYAPIDKAVGFIMGIFGFDAPDTVLTDEEGEFIGLRELAIKAVKGVYEYVKSFFQFDFPSVGELFQGAKSLMGNLLKAVLPPPDFLTFDAPSVTLFGKTFGGGSISLNPIPDSVYEAAGVNPDTGADLIATGNTESATIQTNSSNSGETLNETSKENAQNGSIQIINANDNSTNTQSSNSMSVSDFNIDGTDEVARQLASIGQGSY